jgi:polyisoprenyl-phosphate glycosyltransferase
MLISVVIPVYKAEACLHELHRRLTGALEPITRDYEIILVEDCGGDRSWDIICSLAGNDPHVKGIQFSRNFGQHYGITAGLDVCSGDWVVVMDCDLQDQPEEIPRLYAKAREGYDVVRARRGKRTDSFFKRVTSAFFFKVFNYLADADHDDQVGNFRIISKTVVTNLLSMREQTRGFFIMVDWLGFPTASIDVAHGERYEGNTTYTLGKLFALASSIIVAYSDKPLRLTVKLGFIMSGLAFSFGLYILARAFISRSPVAGWSSLIVSLYFLSGIIISILGMLGIYLGKVFDETKRRPLYAVRRTTGTSI